MPFLILCHVAIPDPVPCHACPGAMPDLVPCLALLQLLSVSESEEGHFSLVGRLQLLPQVVQGLQLGEVEVTQLEGGGEGRGGI